MNRLVLGLAQAFNSLSLAKNAHSTLPEILKLVYAERCHQAYVITKREPSASNDDILLLAALISCQDEKIPREDILNVLISRMERALSMNMEEINIKGPNKRDIERVASEISAMLTRQILNELERNSEEGGSDLHNRMLPMRRVLAAAAHVGLLSNLREAHESSISAVLYATLILCFLHAAYSALSSTQETRKYRIQQTIALVDAAAMFLDDAVSVLSLLEFTSESSSSSSSSSSSTTSSSSSSSSSPSPTSSNSNSNELTGTIPRGILTKKRRVSSIEADAAELLRVLVSGGSVDSKHGLGGEGAMSLRKLVLALLTPTTGLSIDEARSFSHMERSLSNLLDASRWAGSS
jgi:hypothetical protein